MGCKHSVPFLTVGYFGFRNGGCPPFQAAVLGLEYDWRIEIPEVAGLGEFGCWDLVFRQEAMPSRLARLPKSRGEKPAKSIP
jgi:hypothetical protein